MNNQEKFITWSRRLKVHRANSQKMSYHVRFSRYCSQQQHFLSTVILWFHFFSTFFCFLFVCVYVLKQKVYILIHIRLCGRVSDKRNFTLPISENNSIFFWSKKKEHNQQFSVQSVKIIILRIYFFP